MVVSLVCCGMIGLVQIEHAYSRQLMTVQSMVLLVMFGVYYVMYLVVEEM